MKNYLGLFLILFFLTENAFSLTLTSILQGGNARQMLEHAPRFEHGEGVKKNYGAAIKLYCAAYESGKGATKAHAARQIGWMYANGRGVNRDDDLAAAWLQKAHHAGCSISGRLLTKGISAMGPAPEAVCRLPDDGTGEKVIAIETLIRRPTDGAEEGVTELTVIDSNNYTQDDITHLINVYARQRYLDPDLVSAVVEQESNRNPDAVSPKGAMGLMQLMPKTAAELRVDNPMDVQENLRGGTTYLAYLMRRFKDPRLAVGAYHQGPTAVERAGNRILKSWPITIDYVNKVFRRWHQ